MRFWNRDKEITKGATLTSPLGNSSSDVRFVWLFAHMVCTDRRAEVVELSDLLAGIYISSLEKLSMFWSDWQKFEELVERECALRDPRWFYWTRAYDAIRHPSRDSFTGKFKRCHPEVEETKNEVKEIAKRRADAPQFAVINSRDILFSIARRSDRPLGKKLADSGLDLVRLQNSLMH